MTTTMRSGEKPSRTNWPCVSVLTGPCRESVFYVQTFAEHKTTTCDLCPSISHTTKFRSLSIPNHRFQSRTGGLHQIRLLVIQGQTDMDVRVGSITERKYVGRVKRIWYFSPMRAAKVQASLRIRAVSLEPPLLAHTSSGSRGTFRQKARSLASLNGWTCAVTICHDGILKDTNSLDVAHVTILIPLTAVMPLTRTFQGSRTFAVFVRHPPTQHSNVPTADYQGQTTTSYSIQTVTKNVSWFLIILHVLYQIWIASVCSNTINIDRPGVRFTKVFMT